MSGLVASQLVENAIVSALAVFVGKVVRSSVAEAIYLLLGMVVCGFVGLFIGGRLSANRFLIWVSKPLLLSVAIAAVQQADVLRWI